MSRILCVFLTSAWLAFCVAYGSDLYNETGAGSGGVKRNQTLASEGLEILGYAGLASEVAREGTDDLLEVSLSGIGALRSSLEALNQTRLDDLESAFNETYLRYREDFASFVERSGRGGGAWFSNIDAESQGKLRDLLVLPGKKGGVRSVPLNYVAGMDASRWYPVLDSMNIFAISMLSGGATGSQRRQELSRSELQQLVDGIGNFLVLSSQVTSRSSCRQIAWQLVVGEQQSVAILNGVSRKLVRRLQSSISLLRRSNERVIRQHNALVSKRRELDSNIRGLLDVIIKARSDKLDSLVTVEDVHRDLEALRAHYVELWKERSEWILSNRRLVRQLVDWLQVSVNLVYRVALTISKSVLAYSIRNLSDLVYTLKENGGDPERVRQEVEGSLEMFGFALEALRGGVVSMRSERDLGVFRSAWRRLEKHYLWLRRGYLETWEVIFSKVRETDPRAQLEEFLKASSDLVSDLWRSDLKSPFKFDSNLEAHNLRILGLFRRVGSFLGSEKTSRYSEIQAAVLRLRYYNEMLFPDLRLQIELVDRERERYSLTENFDQEVLEHLLNHAFLNESVERCSSGFGRSYISPALRLGVSDRSSSRVSMWEDESKLISGEEELGQISVDFFLGKRARSLVKRFFGANSTAPGSSEEGDLRRQRLGELLDLKEKLVRQNFNLQKELEALSGDGSEPESFTKSLIDRAQRLEKHIQTLDFTISNMESSDQESLDLLLGISKSLLAGEGGKAGGETAKERQVSVKRVEEEVSRFKRELGAVKTALDRDLKLMRRISKYSSEISILDDNIKLINKYLSNLEARIDLFCGRINKDGDPKTSRLLSILKYTVRRKKPDTECESLTLEFAKAKETVSPLLKDASDEVSEYNANFRSCSEVEEISSRFGHIAKDFQKARRELQILQTSYLDSSLEHGAKILERSVLKLSQDSKGVNKELKCYAEIISSPEAITTYIKNIRKEMFRLQNTIERELNRHMFRK
ncbi:hypothetical protein OJ253_2993 [Cryptosporidium canis]|uniref:Uncharacterized protein n=1 Tax=Cryptosporidium canis TaxID=195482 RepID=A0A9D5DFQ2_9CRYT|nr:hypothetical protein OJ253_2993 [Cryptosporidium canis]